MRFKSKFLILILISFLINSPYIIAQSESELNESGKEKLAKDDIDAAFEFYSKAVEMNSSSTEALFGRGRCYYIFEQYKQAMDDFNAVIKLNGDYYQAYLYRGNIQLKLKNEKEALNDYTKAIKINPEYVDGYVQRAYLYRRLSDPDGALNDFNMAILNKTTDADVYYNRADMLYEIYGKIDKAILDYTKAIELSPDFREAFYYRGICYEGIKKYSEAAEDLTTTINMGMKDSLAYKKRANAYFMSENYAAAIADYTLLLTKYKVRDVTIPFNRGISYNKSGMYEKAVKDFTTSLMFDRENAEAYLQRAWANIQLNHISTAMADYLNAEHLSPKKPGIFEARGDLLYKLNKFQESIKDYDKAISLKSSPVLYYKRGQSKEMLKNKDEACQDYKKAYESGYEDAKEKTDNYCSNQE